MFCKKFCHVFFSAVKKFCQKKSRDGPCLLCEKKREDPGGLPPNLPIQTEHNTLPTLTVPSSQAPQRQAPNSQAVTNATAPLASSYATIAASSSNAPKVSTPAMDAEYRDFCFKSNVAFVYLPSNVTKSDLSIRLKFYDIRFLGIGRGPGQGNVLEVLLASRDMVNRLSTIDLNFPGGQGIVDDCSTSALHKSILRNVPIAATKTHVISALEKASNTAVKVVRLAQHSSLVDGEQLLSGTWTLWYSNCSNWIDRLVICDRLVSAMLPNACFSCGKLGHMAKRCDRTRDTNKRGRQEPSVSPPSPTQISTSTNANLPAQP